MQNHPPKTLQAYLWSADINDLRLQEDKNYIIHQLFAYGGIPQWQWLFKTYSLKTMHDVFLNKPAKIYRPETFNFIKNILLSLNNKHLVKEYYVINTPRIIRRKKTVSS